MIHCGARSLFLVSTLALTSCAQLPAEVDRAPSHALRDTADTLIGRVVAPLAAAHPDESGAYPLFSGGEAFAARWALAGRAERSLDVQYYIWRPDVSGSLMAHALREAAARGVRVRILLDDANSSGLDADIAAVAAEPNIEVRLFNPFANRTWHIGDFVGDFARVNRRMHNKSFIADNQVAVIGGRNIGDEYLGAESLLTFNDLDVITIGPVVDEVSTTFDAFWNSPSAYPARSLLATPSARALADIDGEWTRQRAGPSAAAYLEVARELSLLTKMRTGTLAFAWGSARILSDDPDKVRQVQGRETTGIRPTLRAAFAMPQRELLLVSPYFVPGVGTAGILAGLAQRGIRVCVLTNSLAATDVPATYAGYLRYRDTLLRAGVRLYEFKPSVHARTAPDAAESRRRGVSGNGGLSSVASLHAKTLVVDRTRAFVGSYNIDPRSVALNTEMGILMESPDLAGWLVDIFSAHIAHDAYEVQLDKNGAAVWIDRTGEVEVRHTSVPGAGTLRRGWVELLRLLPIEWLL